MKRLTLLFTALAVVGTLLLLHRRESRSEHDAHSISAAPVAPALSVPVVHGPVRVHVFGALRLVGDFELSRPSLAEVLSRGIPYILSDLKRVRVYRLDLKSGVRVKDQVIDATRVLESGAPDVVIEDGDFVFVPEKIL